MEQTKVFEVDLQAFRGLNSRIFTSRSLGRFVRKASQIDTIEGFYDKIDIKIPNDIVSINPSFLQEFLINVITKLGERAFRNKFHFVNQGAYKIDQDLDEAIDRINCFKTNSGCV